MAEDLEDFENLCKVVGYVAIHWAVLEQALDFCVAITFHNGGKQEVREDIPVSLESKVDFLKKCYRRLSPLAPVKDSAIDILIAVNNFAQKRHDLIHGAVASLEAKDGKYTLLRTVYAKQMHATREVTLDLRNFPTLSGELVDLQTRAIRLVSDTMNAIAPGGKFPEPHP